MDSIATVSQTQTKIATTCPTCHMEFGRHVFDCPDKGKIGFQKELEGLLNKYSTENGSNTPDFILAQYLIECLATFNKITVARAEWYGHMDKPGQSKEKV